MNIISYDKACEKEYDFLLIGAGLFNAVIAHRLTDAGYTCLVVERRSHIGGNCYTLYDNLSKCHEHVYGPHIFHTNDKEVWDYVNGITKFHNFINSPVANYNGVIYNLPFNMNTFSKLFGVTNPDDAREAIMEDRVIPDNVPENLEQQALAMVGKKIYKTLIKGYTEKQWGTSCKDLPPSIIKRIPLRFTYDNNYFNDEYQGIPTDGYSYMFEKMFSDCDVILNDEVYSTCDSIKSINIKSPTIKGIVIYTGRIDKFFNYKFGKLDYRSLRFEKKVINKSDYQGNAVVNYTSGDVDYTRIVEHKHFMKDIPDSDYTIITKEYPVKSDKNNEPCYPVLTGYNIELYNRYREEANNLAKDGIFIEGRLGRFEYNDMDKTIRKAFDFINMIEF